MSLRKQQAEKEGLVVNGFRTSLACSVETSTPDIFAIGERVSWENKTIDIIAPQIEMADGLSFNRTQTSIKPFQMSWSRYQAEATASRSGQFW